MRNNRKAVLKLKFRFKDSIVFYHLSAVSSFSYILRTNIKICYGECVKMLITISLEICSKILFSNTILNVVYVRGGSVVQW